MEKYDVYWGDTKIGFTDAADMDFSIKKAYESWLVKILKWKPIKTLSPLPHPIRMHNYKHWFKKRRKTWQNINSKQMKK